MKGLTVNKIAEACGGVLIGNTNILEHEVSCVVTDSRSIRDGGAFVAIKGERVDGHDYISDVFTKGARICIGEADYEPKDNETYVKVSSSVEALGRIAKAYMKILDIPVVGVTGSVGKTGTKEMIASVLSVKYKTAKTKGNFNNEIGLPLTCLDIPDDTQIAVLEMGISAENEMDYLTDIVSLLAAVVTNIGVSHMEILGSREGIYNEKIKIGKDLPDSGILILNGDDDILAGSKPDTAAKTIRYGSGVSNDICLQDYRPKGIEGSEFVIMGLKCAPEGLEICLNIPGKHSAQNALAAAAVGEHFLLDSDEIKRGLETARTINGRMNIIKTGGITVIDDAYNASPVSMKAAIETLSYAPGRKICVLGNMYELGDDSRRMHYDTGRTAAQNGVDVLFTCGDLAVDIARGALGLRLSADLEASVADECVEVMMTDPDMAVVPEFYLFDNTQMLIKKLKSTLREGDTVLIKASNSMGFGDIVKGITG